MLRFLKRRSLLRKIPVQTSVCRGSLIHEKYLILSSCFAFLTTLHFSTAAAGQNEDLEKMFEERIRSVVAVEYFVQTEIDRQPFSALGLVADDSGLIVLQDHSILTWIAVDRLKQFKVRLLRGREEFDAEYLGEEPVNGWHFLRVSDEEFYEKVVPVTAYEIAEAKIGEQLWGFGAMDEDHDFEPFFLMGRFSLLRPLPLPFGFTMIPVTGPGSLVFNLSG